MIGAPWRQGVTAMTEGEWLTSEDPRAMLAAVRGTLSVRKVRLLICACCRSGNCNSPEPVKLCVVAGCCDSLPLGGAPWLFLLQTIRNRITTGGGGDKKIPGLQRPRAVPVILHLRRIPVAVCASACAATQSVLADGRACRVAPACWSRLDDSGGCGRRRALRAGVGRRTARGSAGPGTSGL